MNSTPDIADGQIINMTRSEDTARVRVRCWNGSIVEFSFTGVVAIAECLAGDVDRLEHGGVKLASIVETASTRLSDDGAACEPTDFYSFCDAEDNVTLTVVVDRNGKMSVGAVATSDSGVHEP